LGKFGSIQNIQKASIEELASIPGVSEDLAHQIKNQLE